MRISDWSSDVCSSDLEGLSKEEPRLQHLISEQREAEAKIETGRVLREESMEALNKAQAEGYEVGGNLARIEQQIAHQREMAQRLQRARDEAQAALAEIGEHIHGDEARLQVLQETIADAQPRLEQLREEDGVRQDALRDAEAALRSEEPTSELQSLMRISYA